MGIPLIIRLHTYISFETTAEYVCWTDQFMHVHIYGVLIVLFCTDYAVWWWCGVTVLVGCSVPPLSFGASVCACVCV